MQDRIFAKTCAGSSKLFWRHSRNGKKPPGTSEPTTAFSRAGGTEVGNPSGAKRSYANTFVQLRTASGFRNESDGIRSGTHSRLCCEASVQSSK